MVSRTVRCRRPSDAALGDPFLDASREATPTRRGLSVKKLLVLLVLVVIGVAVAKKLREAT
jgi:hypothetical protein